MTSWFKAVRKSTKPKELAYTFEVTNTEGFCTQFNNYLYAYLTAKAYKRNLYVFDKNNTVSNSFSLIESTFVKPTELNPELKFTDLSMLQYQKLTLNQTFPVTRTLSFPEIKSAASNLFKINPEILKECNQLLSTFVIPAFFDIGIHIRTGYVPISINAYYDAIKEFQKANKLEELSVFVMTDNYKSFEALKSRADPSWTLYTLDSSYQSGYNNGEYKQLPTKQRRSEYIKFISELLIMRGIRAIVCTLSSNVGRWLYVNIQDGSYLKSLDTTYAPN